VIPSTQLTPRTASLDEPAGTVTFSGKISEIVVVPVVPL
jgi:hypothetical protein